MSIPPRLDGPPHDRYVVTKQGTKIYPYRSSTPDPKCLERFNERTSDEALRVLAQGLPRLDVLKPA
jgi:hypothetical protein